jgi:5-methylcytosine-specific restriction protein A
MRGGAAFRAYDRKWREARAAYLRRHPLCVSCQADGKLVPATVVDHVLPHRGDQRLFWDVNNWQSLCHECHSRKTYSEVRESKKQKPAEDPDMNIFFIP